MKKLLVLLLLSLVVLLPACSKEKTTANASKAIKVGVCPGPYGDMFTDAIKPGLEAKGYAVEVVEFSDYVQPNKALANGEIAVNLFQHLIYLENFKKDYSLDLTAIAFVPTAAAGIYSKTITSVDNIPSGTQVALSNDITNEARAFRILEAAGFVKMDHNAESSKYTEANVVENPSGLVFVPMEAAQTPRALDSVGFSVVNGNYAIGAGLDLSTALYTEQLEPNLKNVIAIRTSSVGTDLEKDLLDVVKSDEFKKIMEDPKFMYHTFQQPNYQLYK